MGTHKVEVIVYFHRLTANGLGKTALVDTDLVRMSFDVLLAPGRSINDIIITMAKQYCDFYQVIFSHVERVG